VIGVNWAYHGMGICDACDGGDQRLYRPIRNGVPLPGGPYLCARCRIRFLAEDEDEDEEEE